MFKEFKNFAMSGNLIDIAVGLVMATAFGGIVAAFVDGVFMPLVGQIFQLGDFSKAKYVLAAAVMGPDGKESVAESAILYGSLLAKIINFVIVAFVMFMIIKAMNRNKQAEPAPAPPADTVLLTEIRDLLKK